MCFEVDILEVIYNYDEILTIYPLSDLAGFKNLRGLQQERNEKIKK